jgi:hypothetical protein
MATLFVRTDDVVAHAHVCRDIPPKYVRSKKKEKLSIPASSKAKYQKIVLKIPDEIAFALIEIHGGGLQHAIMKHLKSTVNPINTEE